MSNFKNKLEVATNITILLVSVIFIAILIQKFYFPSSNNPNQIEVGSQINLSNVDWKEADKTLLLVLKKGCDYCAKSAGFYKELVSTTRDKKVKIIAVLPSEIQESRSYLDDLGLQNLEVTQAELNSINVVATPTIVLLDRQGKVVESWVGQLTPEIEQKVIEKL